MSAPSVPSIPGRVLAGPFPVALSADGSRGVASKDGETSFFDVGIQESVVSAPYGSSNNRSDVHVRDDVLVSPDARRCMLRDRAVLLVLEGVRVGAYGLAGHDGKEPRPVAVSADLTLFARYAKKAKQIVIERHNGADGVVRMTAIAQPLRVFRVLFTAAADKLLVVTAAVVHVYAVASGQKLNAVRLPKMLSDGVTVVEARLARDNTVLALVCSALARGGYYNMLVYMTLPAASSKIAGPAMVYGILDVTSSTLTAHGGAGLRVANVYAHSPKTPGVLTLLPSPCGGDCAQLAQTRDVVFCLDLGVTAYSDVACSELERATVAAILVKTSAGRPVARLVTTPPGMLLERTPVIGVHTRYGGTRGGARAAPRLIVSRDGSTVVALSAAGAALHWVRALPPTPIGAEGDVACMQCAGTAQHREACAAQRVFCGAECQRDYHAELHLDAAHSMPIGDDADDADDAGDA